MPFFATLCLFSFLPSCSTIRVPGLKMLERRADYESNAKLDGMLKQTSTLFVPKKTRPKEVDIYIHPHETPHGDYFRGGFIRSIIEDSHWEVFEEKGGEHSE